MQGSIDWNGWGMLASRIHAPSVETNKYGSRADWIM